MTVRKKSSLSVSARVAPRFRVIVDDVIVLGPGKVELLKLIAQTGSISEAARLMEMSYNRAWTLVKVMNGAFAEPLVESTRGGASGGGALLSATGRQALELYRQMEEKAMQATAGPQHGLIALLKR